MANYGEFNGKHDRFKKDMTQFIDTSFPQGESYKEVETRIDDFLEMLKSDYDVKHIAIVAHQAPQLALDVLIDGKTWEQALAEDWRNTKSWQPGWKYQLVE